MTMDVRTPITQALNDGALSRRELKALMKRSNGPALAWLAGHLGLLALTGLCIWAALGTWWLWPAMFVHGVVLVHLFALQHECVHYTPFRTRWLNDVIGGLCGLAIINPHQHFRYEHCDHHTYTQINGHDPEMIALPRNLWGYLWYLSAIPYWTNYVTQILRYSAGRLNDVDRTFITGHEAPIVFREARLMLAFYLGLAAVSLALGWIAPLVYWLGPLLLGQPVMRAIRLSEHVGRPTVDDLTENTRTSLVSRPLQFLCWNMNYHAEHHYAASVPFHALPRLHAKLDGYVHVEPRGYLGAQLDILRQLTGRAPRADAGTPAE